MFLNKEWINEDINKLYEVDLEELEPVTLLTRPEHDVFAERIRKSLYYGKLPTDDRPSLPMTEIAVNYIRDAAPRELGKIDMYLASDIGKKAYVSPCSLMLGMIYIERLKHKNPDYLNTVSSSDLFLISMMVASKYLYDEGIDEEVYNDEWAEAADLETSDVNALEVHFLSAINWSLFTHPEEFERILKSMEESTAYSEGLRRGFWTYLDCMILLQNVQLNSAMLDAMRQLCKVVAVCSIAYIAGLLTILASVSTLSLLRAHGIPVAIVTDANQHSTNMAVPIQGSGHFYDVAMEMTNENVDGEAASIETETDWVGNESDKDLGFVDTLSMSFGIETRNADRLFTDRNERISTNRIASMEIDEDSNLTDIDIRERASSPIGLTLPGFLTLTLIKDTMSHFLVALKDEPNSAGNHVQRISAPEVTDFETKSTHACTCDQSGVSGRTNFHGGITHKASSSSFGQCISPYTLWTSLKHFAKHYAEFHDTAPLKVKSNDLSCKGNMCLTEWKHPKLSDSVNFIKSKNCCGAKSSAESINADRVSRCNLFDEFSDVFTSFRLTENIAVDLLLGFHTTGFVSI